MPCGGAKKHSHGGRCPVGKQGVKFNTKILTAKMHATSVANKYVLGHLAVKFKQDRKSLV